MPPRPQIPPASGHDNLRRLQWLRDFAIAGLALLVAIADPLFRTLVPLAPATGLLALWIILSIVTWKRLRRARPVTPRELLLHIGIDLAMLTALLAISGGPANPLTALYLPHIAIAAAVLPSRHAWLVALLGVAAYSLLWEFSLPLTVEDVDRAMQMHLTGMWLTFVASALLIVGFIGHITLALREREQQLAAAREQTLRDERIVALGNLAAGAAHELGTPLATMAVITGELTRDPALPAALQEDIKLLGEQISACKGIISSLAERAGVRRAESGQALAVDQWIEHLVLRWRTLRPHVLPHLTLAAESGHTQPAPRLFAETTLEQALLNLFNNAADASPQDIEIVAQWNAERLCVDIFDRGPGIDAALLAQAGREFFSTRSEGSGIGLFLAHAALNRHGGTITMEPRVGGGTLTRVILPLQTLLAQSDVK